jgi:hypothetical protein
VILFYANYGYYLSSGTISTENNILSPSLVSYWHWLKAVVENCQKALEQSSEQMKKYEDQSRMESPSFEPCNLAMRNRMNIQLHHPARNLEHQMYGPFEICEFMSPRIGRLHLAKPWKIYPVFHVSLIEPCIKSNCDGDLNAILKTSDPIENAPDYDIEEVIGSTEQYGKV